MTDLYRHFNRNGRLLYVGVSLSVLIRTLSHRNLSVWFGDVVTITIERFETREQALIAESKAIKEEKPMFNLDQTPERRKYHRGMVSAEIAETTYDAKEIAVMMGLTAQTINIQVDYNRSPFRPISDKRPYRFLKTEVDAILNGARK